MSINGSVQQLGSGLAALFAGAIVSTEKSGKILHYNWVGYLSIVVLIASLVYGRMIFRKMDEKVVEVKDKEALEELDEQVVTKAALLDKS